MVYYVASGNVFPVLSPPHIIYRPTVCNCEDSVVESGVCGGASEFDIAGTGVLSTRGG